MDKKWTNRRSLIRRLHKLLNGLVALMGIEPMIS